jgi:hypothetical protein
VDWARAFFRDTAPYATGGAYVNFITDDEDRVAAAYGTNLQRLIEVHECPIKKTILRTSSEH